MLKIKENFKISLPKFFVKVVSILAIAFSFLISGACAKLGEDPQAYNYANADSNLPPLSITPENPRVVQGQTKRFHGQGGFIGDIGYRYSLTGIAGSTPPGSLDPITGIYTAPDVVDPNNAVGFATVTDATGSSVTTTVITIVNLELTPSSHIVTAKRKANYDVIGGEPPFTWCVIDIGTGVCLADADIGSISSTGLFSAKELSGSSTVQVMDASGNIAQAVIVVQPVPVLYPSGVSIPYGWTMQMSTIGGTAPFVYTVDLSTINGGGSITTDGLYIAPTTQMTSTIEVKDYYTYSSKSDFYIINPNKISSGDNFNCILFSDSQGVKCWGDSAFEQTGYPTTLLSDGTIGTDDKLGNESGEIGSRVKVHNLRSGSPATFIISKQIASGANHSCALDGAANVRCWGWNSYGQLGRNEGAFVTNDPAKKYLATSNTIVTFTSGANVLAGLVAAGKNHTCALATNLKDLYCWGDNTNNQLAACNGTICDGATYLLRPNLSYKLTLPSEALDLKAGDGHTCVLLKGTPTFNSNVNQIRCWGDNRKGQLGIGNVASPDDYFGNSPTEWVYIKETNGSERPVMFTNPSSALPIGDDLMPIALEVGGSHSCALLNDNTVRCWGLNDQGQLGRGATLAPDLFAIEPDTVGIDLNDQKVIKIKAGYNKTCFILLGGFLECVGSNVGGSLGIENSERLKVGTIASEMGNNLLNISIDIAGFATDLSIGKEHVCAMLNDNRTKCWGNNAFGQLGINSETSYGGNVNEMGRFLPGVGFF